MNAKPITLALQGGGSHGAFTWGVLDRLLEDERVQIEALSGASAGAINAALLAYGYTVGGRAGARHALQDFWEGIAAKAQFNSVPQDLSTGAARTARSGSEAAIESLFSLMQFVAPSLWNPLDFNPLRDLLAEKIDFVRLRRDCTLDLYIAATRVSSGMLRLFQTRELSLEVLLASACLPSLHHPIEIDGEAYWDGGLTANPPVNPLAYESAARDLVLVLVQPLHHHATPGSAAEIRRRLGEIGFSSAFFSEMQSLALSKRELARSPIAFGRLQRCLGSLRIHAIDSPEFMSRLTSISKLNVHAGFIRGLRDEGRARASRWLEEKFGCVGLRSSYALERFLPMQVETRRRDAPPALPHLQNSA